MDVGFIGLGSMGSRIVSLLLDGGHHVTVWARRPASAAPFAGRVDVASSPKEVARASDLIGLCVWDQADVEEVLGGDAGVLSGVRRSAVIAIHSTVSPAGCQRLEQMASAAGADLIDAPVSVGANLPRLLMMVGGEPGAVERAGEGLSSVADPFLHLGPVGAGQIAKLVNNTLLAAAIGLGEDAIALGAALGLDADALHVALASGSARGTWSRFVGASQMAATTSAGAAATEWARKDVGYALRLAEDAGLDLDSNVLRLALRGVDVIG